MVDRSSPIATRLDADPKPNRAFIKKHLLFLAVLAGVTVAIGVAAFLAKALQEQNAMSSFEQLVGTAMANHVHDSLCPRANALKKALPIWLELCAPLIAAAWVLLNIAEFKKLTKKEASP
jgi:hypothetical protein